MTFAELLSPISFRLRPAAVIDRLCRLICTAPQGVSNAHGSAISAGSASLFSLPE
jgi:hypothetical protein